MTITSENTFFFFFKDLLIHSRDGVHRRGEYRETGKRESPTDSLLSMESSAEGGLIPGP